MATEIAPESALESASALAQFDAELEGQQMEGHWRGAVGLPTEPRSRIQPYIWKWDLVYRQLLRAGELVPLDGREGRRTLRLLNPGRGFTTHTIHMSVQLVKPGEIAEAHRHTLAALRFVVQGSGAYTSVEGERFPLHAGDLILTPQWTWHDHGNESAEPIVWLDGLDSPLVSALDAGFFEPYPEATQPVTRPAGWTLEQSGLLRPARHGGTATSPTAFYPWEIVSQQLERRAASDAGSPCDGVVLEYANPFTGGPTLPTIGCWLQLLRPGERTRRHRHTSSGIYYVVRGSGCTVVQETRLEWSRGDVFVVPNWSWHSHENRSASEDAVLFSMNDIPIYDAFGLYREQSEG